MPFETDDLYFAEEMCREQLRISMALQKRNEELLRENEILRNELCEGSNQNELNSFFDNRNFF